MDLILKLVRASWVDLFRHFNMCARLEDVRMNRAMRYNVRWYFPDQHYCFMRVNPHLGIPFVGMLNSIQYS